MTRPNNWEGEGERCCRESLRNELARSIVLESPLFSPRGVYFALATLTRFFVVPMPAQIGEDPGLFTLLLEAPECALEALVVVDDHLGHNLLN